MNKETLELYHFLSKLPDRPSTLNNLQRLTKLPQAQCSWILKKLKQQGKKPSHKVDEILKYINGET